MKMSDKEKQIVKSRLQLIVKIAEDTIHIQKKHCRDINENVIYYMVLEQNRESRMDFSILNKVIYEILDNPVDEIKETLMHLLEEL